MKRTWLMGVLLTYAMAGAALAAVPSTMTYQGVLASSSGAVVPDGAYWVRFGLYTTVSAGDTSTAIWRELVQVQTVKGIFTALLGNSTSLASVPFDVPYWLGLSVAGGAELRPRIALTASPYSLNSRGGGGGITGVTAGAGLSGGGTAGTVRLDVGAGTGISVAGDTVSLNTGFADGRYVRAWEANSVTSGMLVDGSVTSADIADGAVGSADLASGGVIASKMALPQRWSTSGGFGDVFSVTNSGTGDGINCYATGGGSAGYFSGPVYVVGTLYVSGLITKPGGGFKIDHPLEPATKYLYHSFVESPDMLNLYTGTVVLDGTGEAWVDLPGWFEALNRDFTYQLTPIGRQATGLYVGSEVSGNRFKISGGSAGLKVSWQVTGVRHDAWAEAHRIPVEEAKPAAESGYYLHPELLGQSEERGVEWADKGDVLRQVRELQRRSQSSPGGK